MTVEALIDGMTTIHGRLAGLVICLREGNLDGMRAVLRTLGKLTQEEASSIMRISSCLPDEATLDVLEEFKVPGMSHKNHEAILAAVESRANIEYILRLSNLGYAWTSPEDEQAALRIAIYGGAPELILPALQAGVPAFIKHKTHINPVYIATVFNIHLKDQFRWIEAVAHMLNHGGRAYEPQDPSTSCLDDMTLSASPKTRPFIESAERMALAMSNANLADPWAARQAGKLRL